MVVSVLGKALDAQVRVAFACLADLFLLIRPDGNGVFDLSVLKPFAGGGNGNRIIAVLSHVALKGEPALRVRLKLVRLIADGNRDLCARQRYAGKDRLAGFKPCVRRAFKHQRAGGFRRRERKAAGGGSLPLACGGDGDGVRALAVKEEARGEIAVFLRAAVYLCALADDGNLCAFLAAAADGHGVVRDHVNHREIERQPDRRGNLLHHEVHVLQALAHGALFLVLDQIPAGLWMMRGVAEHIRLAVCDLHVQPAALVAVRCGGGEAGVHIVLLAAAAPRGIVRRAEIKRQVVPVGLEIVHELLAALAVQLRVVPDFAGVVRFDDLQTHAAVLQRALVIRFKDGFAGFKTAARLHGVEAVTGDHADVLVKILKGDICPVLLPRGIELDAGVLPCSVCSCSQRGVCAQHEHQRRQDQQHSFHKAASLLSVSIL